MNNNFGVAFITCDREDFLHISMNSFIAGIGNRGDDNVIVVNDGKSLEKDIPYGDLIQNDKNLGVGKSKNKALKELLSRGFDHIFIIEDDIIQKDNSINVFDKYIEYSQKTGIQHFMYGYHGPANKGGVSKGSPLPRSVIDYGNGIEVLLNLHCVGAFCYYSRLCLEEVGLFDENYNNAFEHVDHSYMIAKADMIPGYWWWPDIADSYEYLDEIECSEESSSIRPRADWQENIMKGAETFYKKHGYKPAWDDYVPDKSEYQIKKILKEIHKKYT
jgi:GT2 family glycosyltransferase